MTLFPQQVTGKVCRSKNCPQRGVTVDLNQEQCISCGRALMGVKSPNWIVQVLTLLVTSGVLAGAIKYLGTQKIAVTLLSPEVQIAKPASFPLATEEAQRRLGLKLREIYRDCKVGAEEEAEKERMLASHPELARVHPELERTQLPRILESCLLVRTGQTLIAQKLYEQARAEFLKATQRDPGNANAWTALGAASMLTRREAEARRAYEKALAVDPESWVAHYNYGFYFARKGEKDAAFLHLRQAVNLLDHSEGVDQTAVLDDLRNNPALDPLRRDPRFAKLLG